MDAARILAKAPQLALVKIDANASAISSCPASASDGQVDRNRHAHAFDRYAEYETIDDGVPAVAAPATDGLGENRAGAVRVFGFGGLVHAAGCRDVRLPQLHIDLAAIACHTTGASHAHVQGDLGARHVGDDAPAGTTAAADGLSLQARGQSAGGGDLHI